MVGRRGDEFVSGQPTLWVGSLIVALALAAVYASASEFLPIQVRFPRRWLSLAAGVSVAYVFVDILPELEARRRALVSVMGKDLLFAEQRLYLAALAGFVFFYTLEQLLLSARSRRGPEAQPGGVDGAFRLRVGGYALYSWLIGYLLPDRAARGSHTLALYGVAMALHLSLIGSALAREHGRAYDRIGWVVLAASVLAGWLVSVAVRTPEIVIDRLFAFVAGGVVMTSMNEELPREREGRFGWFVLGAAAYAILLLLAA